MQLERLNHANAERWQPSAAGWKEPFAAVADAVAVAAAAAGCLIQIRMKASMKTEAVAAVRMMKGQRESRQGRFDEVTRGEPTVAGTLRLHLHLQLQQQLRLQMLLPFDSI